MSNSLADELLRKGLATPAQHRQIIHEKATRESLESALQERESARNKDLTPIKKVSPESPISYKPEILTCVACSTRYEYYKRPNYTGKNPRRCPDCQLHYEELSKKAIGNRGLRPAGHKTRQQHKRVHPGQL